MSTKKIRIIALRMGQTPAVEEIDPGLESMQKFVGGYIECVQLEAHGNGGVDLWCNEEGLFTCEPNRHVTTDWGYNQTINGDMFIARHTRGGKTVGLTDAQVAKWLKLSAEWPRAITSLDDPAETAKKGGVFLIM
jgi:hypothetical protein